MSRPLSTTSYAILGLLAIRPWTPYELTRQMRMSLGRFWPRAESKLYEEPKKLAALGLVEATPDQAGGRRRMRYTITDAGRSALRTWLATPSAGPVLEAEPLVRLFVAEHGTKTDLLDVLQRVHRWAGERLAEDAAIAQHYLDGEGAFPRRIAHLTLVGRFLSDFALMTHEWSRWALSTVGSWPEDVGKAEADRASLAVIAERGAFRTGNAPG